MTYDAAHWQEHLDRTPRLALPHLGCEKWLGDRFCGEPACMILGIQTSADWRLCDHHADDIRLRFPEYVLRRHACSVCDRTERWRSRLDAQGRCNDCRP